MPHADPPGASRVDAARVFPVSDQGATLAAWRGVLAAGGAWALLSAFPSFEMTVLARAAAVGAGVLGGSPVFAHAEGWALPGLAVPVVVTQACSAMDFCVLGAAVLGWGLASRVGAVRAAGLAWLLCAPFAIAINVLRLVVVAQAHRWVFPLFPANIEPGLHMLAGLLVFLPSLIVLHLFLSRHGRPSVSR